MTHRDGDRLRAIYEKVNILEGLHKSCQLAQLGLEIAVVNESRYLARALADAVYYAPGTEEHLDAVHRAELAVHSGINDAIDSLLVFVKATLNRLKERYPKFDIANSKHGDAYIQALTAMLEVEKSVVASREQRRDRFPIYKRLAERPGDLKIISDFALSLIEIEGMAQRNPALTDPTVASSLHENLLQALSREGPAKLALEYQAKYRLDHGKPICFGAEALLRMKIGGVAVPPPTVITFAEGNGLIRELGRWVLKEALSAMARRSDIPCIAVNISAAELDDVNYSADVLQALRESGVDPKRLELEITETVAITDGEAENHLQKLADVGVRIAVDDFGTGLTKFDYLARVRIATLKIDRSLVLALQRDASYRPLIAAIAGIGQHCSLDVVAEGIETQQQVEIFDQLGINRFQGFFFAKPISFEDFSAKYPA